MFGITQKRPIWTSFVPICRCQACEKDSKCDKIQSFFNYTKSMK